MAGCLQPRRSIDEKERIIDVMFFAGFREDHLGQSLCSCRLDVSLEQAIGLGIDRFIQPIVFKIESDNRFVNCNVIRISSLNRL